MSSMDDILRRSLLFDFYGELLTDHQKNMYEAFYGDDLSLGEIAEEFGISRQGVHDLIRRTDQVLEKYEEKLHLVERFLMVKDQAEEIGKLAHSISRDTGAFTDSEGSANHIRLERIIELAERLVDEL